MHISSTGDAYRSIPSRCEAVTEPLHRSRHREIPSHSAPARGGGSGRRSGFRQLDSDWRVVARLFAGPHLPVDTGRDKAAGNAGLSNR
jgi:hypothetical protein